MDLAKRVARRFLAFKYQPKESKKNKVERLTKLIREKTGLSKGVSEDIADAVLRKRDLERLALQKSWPVEDGKVTGNKGSISFTEIENAV